MDSFSTTKMTKLESTRNRPTKREKQIMAIEKRLGKNKKKEKPVALKIYAELNRKNYQQILNDELEISVPHGVKMKNKVGSRGLFFECTDEESAQMLMDGLDASGICWQEND